VTDNSLRGAQSIGALSGRPVVRRSLVDRRDRFDFFKFTLNRSSSVKFQLSGLRNNADLFLLNRAGRVIGRSQKNSSQAEGITQQLTAGTYYIKVLNRTSFGTRYKLTGSANPPGTSGTIEDPIDLGTLTNIPVVRSRDTAGSTNETAKFYKFQLGQISTLSGALSQVTGGGFINLYYDSNRNGRLDLSANNVPGDLRITSASGSESSNSPFFKALPVGTYFLAAVQNTTATTLLYDFTLRPTPIPGNIPADPGSEPTTAYNLGTLNPGGRLEVRDYAGEIDATDIYRFTLSTASTVRLTEQETGNDSMFGDLFTFIYQDNNNNNILESSEIVATRATPLVNLQAGDYYLSVRNSSSFSNVAYTATITA
jgi:Bacterial pre-peptidase C-terminal domain